MISGNHGHDWDDFTAVLIEAYIYLTINSQLEHSPSRESWLALGQTDPIFSELDGLRRHDTFGFFLGSASQLYELMPQVTQLVQYLEMHSWPEREQRSDGLYNALRIQIASWVGATPSNPDISPQDLRHWNISELAAGCIIQNTLQILLLSSYLNGCVGVSEVLDTVKPFIDRNLALFEIVTGTPAMNVTLWAFMVTGSMLRNQEQQDYLSRKILTHPTRTALGTRVVQILEWVWEGPHERLIGLAGLKNATKEHGTYLCFV